MIARYVDAMRGVPVAHVLGALGLPFSPTRGTTSPGHFPCPVCRCERRHTKSRDRRGACGIAPDGERWSCWQCGAHGDALDLVRHVEGRGRERAWCERWLVLPEAAPPSAPSVPEPSRTPPPGGEVAALLAGCGPVISDPEVRGYLERRGIDPVEVVDRELAFALPEGTSLPSWARWRGRSWSELGHRVIVPLVDATGVVRSVLARRVRDGESPKTLPPSGHARAGLLMACPLARLVLAAGSLPAWADRAHRFRVIVAEGDSDFLHAAVGPSSFTRWADHPQAPPAVLGIESGSWTEALSARLPAGVEVVIATDNDAAGDRYAESIGASVASAVLAGRFTLSRWRVTP